MPFMNKLGRYLGCVCGLVVEREGGNLEPIPLKGVKVHARLLDVVGEVSLQQTYANEEQQPLEAIYMFPLDQSACVVHFEVLLDGKKILDGVVREKEEARKQYEEALESRHTAFLFEESSPDVFKMKVGNLVPGAEAIIKLKYLTELSIEGEALRFYLPTTIAPRFEAEKKEASDTSSIPYTLSSPAPVAIDVECEMKSEILKIEWPTHSISADVEKEQKPGGIYVGKVSLSSETSDMDRDFVLLITLAEPRKPRLCVERSKEGSSAALVSMVPSFESRAEKVEFIFVLDRSGSMSGLSIQQAKKALNLFLHSLPLDCYYNIVGFGNTFQFLFPKSVKYGEETLQKAMEHVKNVDADLGGTEIMEPLKAIFATDPPKDYLRQLLLLTDGEVNNTEDVIRLVQLNSSKARVFALGIGDSASHYLVEGVARAGGGMAEFATYQERLESKVQRQLKNALFPALKDISIKWISGGKALDLTDAPSQEAGGVKIPLEPQVSNAPRQAPSKIPPVFDGSRLVVYSLWEDDTCPTGASITAVTPDGPIEASISVTDDNIFQGDLIHKLAARKLIQDLDDKSASLQDRDDRQEVIKKKIVQLGCKYGLISRYTSFVAVDPEKQAPLDSNWALQSRMVPNQFPHGWHGLDSISEADGSAANQARNRQMLLECQSGIEKKTSVFENQSARVSPLRRKSLPATFFTATCSGIQASLHRVGKMMRKKSVQVDGGSPKMGATMLDTQPEEDVLQVIVSLQRFDGSFNVDSKMADAIGIEWKELEEEGKTKEIEDAIWMTCVAIEYMELALGSRKEDWELVVDKARNWLAQATPQHLEFLQQAKEFLESNGVGKETL